MKKNIFKSILFVGLSVFIITFSLISGVLYKYFIEQQQRQQLDETRLVAHALENEGKQFFNNLYDEDFRITWINYNGDVLYDSDSSVDKMDNHLSRIEIKDAISKGEGQSKRYSNTLTKNLLYSAVKLQDGTILRLSSDYYTIWVLILLMIQPILVVTIIVTCLSIYFANSLSKKIVQPLNEIDLDDPISDGTYEELNPFLLKIYTQQKQLKKQASMLDEKNQEFLAMTSNLAEGLILVDKNLNILTMNVAAKDIFGYRFTNGMSVKEFCNNEDIDDLFIDNLCEHKYVNILVNNKDYEVICSPITSNNEVSGYVLLIIDETEKKVAEKIRKDFTANVSHELKTPLQIISGYAELLKQDTVNENDKKIFTEKIYSESQRMISLVNDIINLSQLDGNDLNTNLEDVDLYECILNVTDSLKEEANSRNITLTVEGSSIKVKAIPQLINGAIYNVCDNAIKYNKDSGNVKINLRNKDDNAILEVIDTGIGISKQDKERVFERFYRVSKSRSKENGGTGLGLSIVKHTIERFFGSVEIESEIDKGTTIRFILPISKN